MSDYGEGKSRSEETYDSMMALGIMMIGVLLLLAVIVVAVVGTSVGWW